ncbi:MAG TPA: sulfatase-like hydrolase/transferase [Vicinamibacterales bacterium]|nr:sulfatase-like hydrolase/transferase [Vicinamibacterales bacterium]
MPRVWPDPWPSLVLCLAAVPALSACGGAKGPAPAGGPSALPSILIVTLDTTRADAVGPDAAVIATPAFNALAARGLRFRHAYAPAPETLPSHSSMMTGLYPVGHGVHENARQLGGHHAVPAERLRQAGYRTASFVSAFVLSRRFGLARGFDIYDDEMPEGLSERTSTDTTDRALAYLAADSPQQALLLWVHYFDPHAPYTPPEPFLSQYPDAPYLGEVAAMDGQARPARAGVRAARRTRRAARRDRGCRRPRRRTRRSRRVAARQPSLSGNDARTAGARRA